MFTDKILKAHTITIKPRHKVDKEGNSCEVHVVAQVTTTHKYNESKQFDVHEIRVTAPTLEDAFKQLESRIPESEAE